MKPMIRQLLAAAIAAILPCLTVPFSSLGATANVSVINDAFVPDSSSINTGDTVLWTWPVGSFSHNTVSDDGIWSSDVFNGPATYSFTFTSPGSFPYSCTVHGFTGTINVAAANIPPTVSITKPAANAVFAAPANVTIQAAPADSDGSVANVQFLVGSTVFTNRTSAPFTVVTNNLPAGSYTLSAIVSDNLGAKNTNTVTISVVTPSPLTISAAQMSPPANFQFTYAANAGLSYVVQRSTNLLAANWTAIATNTAASGSVIFKDTNAAGNPGFYRVGRLPNP